MVFRQSAIGAISAVLLSLLASPPAHALDITYAAIAGGLDSPDCGGTSVALSSSYPCRTLPAALSNVADGGAVICGGIVHYSGFSPDLVLSVTKSVIIDCKEGGGSADVSGITINAPGKNVSLRNITVNPAGLDINPAINIVAAASVDLDNVNVTGSTGRGILDARGVPGKLWIRNSVVVGHPGPGIVIAPRGGVVISAVIDNVSVRDTTYGLAVGTGARVTVNRSVFSQNAIAGIESDTGGIIEINDTLVSNNTTGVLANPNAFITLARSAINSNNTGISGSTGSYGNNRFFANAASNGTAPIPIGSTSVERGLR